MTIQNRGLLYLFLLIVVLAIAVPLLNSFSLLIQILVALAFLVFSSIIIFRVDGKIRGLEISRKELEDKQKALLDDRKKQDALFKLVETAKRQWEKTMDCVGDMVVMTDTSMRVQRCNKAACTFTGMSYDELLGRKWTEIIDDHEMEKQDFTGSSFEYFHKKTGRWFYMGLYTFTGRSGRLKGFVITMHDLTDLKKVSDLLESKNFELESAYAELKQTQSHLLQHEKMASIGQLAAGVAHEINNPVGFISSNLASLGKYCRRLGEFIDLQEKTLESPDQQAISQLSEKKKSLNVDFILEDLAGLIEESLDGCDRVAKIVQDLKGFSRVDQAERQLVDIHECLESTLNIVWNELKYNSTVEKEYGTVDMLECFPQQLNQVFMNILVNASHAIKKDGLITIRTWQKDRGVYVSISDNGQGIKPEELEHIFEPFFTTKETGKGTGLGLSIVYDIIKKNHNGEIYVASEVGKGTSFTIQLPLADNEEESSGRS